MNVDDIKNQLRLSREKLRIANSDSDKKQKIQNQITVLNFKLEIETLVISETILKTFFSEGLKKEDGDEVSSIEIKNILSQLISEENKKKPLTDDTLSKTLKEKGYIVARRTVAKYREQLEIPVARMRKEL